MVKHLATVNDNGHPGVAAVKLIVLNRKHTHCHLCTGFGHCLKECPTYKMVKKAVRNSKVLKGGWKFIYSNLYTMGMLTNAATIIFPATPNCHAGSTKGAILSALITAMSAEEQAIVRTAVGAI